MARRAGSAATVPDGAPDAAALGNLELVRVEHVSDAPRAVHIFGDGGVDSAPPAELLAESHRFSIDLTPQLLLCGGEMVDALRTSGVASYLEFKPVHAHLFAGAGAAELQRVPCGKADIFQSTSISLIEKRVLMKFLQSCLALQPVVEPDAAPPPQALALPDATPEAPPAAPAGTFADWSSAQRLRGWLRAVALYGILQLPSRVGDGAGPSAADGIRSVCRHLRSLGIYGATAYLAHFYGSSELPQAFCRLCAVWGGTYMLQQAPYSLAIGDGEGGGRVVRSVVDASGRTIGCSWLLLNGDCAPQLPPAADGAGDGEGELRATARCVVVLDGPLLRPASSEEPLALAQLAPADGDGDDDATVFVLEQDATASVVPRGKVLVHLSALAAHGPRLAGALEGRAQLAPALERLLAIAAQRAEARRRRRAAAAAGGREPTTTRRPPRPPPPMATRRPRRRRRRARRPPVRAAARGRIAPVRAIAGGYMHVRPPSRAARMGRERLRAGGRRRAEQPPCRRRTRRSPPTATAPCARARHEQVLVFERVCRVRRVPASRAARNAPSRRPRRGTCRRGRFERRIDRSFSMRAAAFRQRDVFDTAQRADERSDTLPLEQPRARRTCATHADGLRILSVDGARGARTSPRASPTRGGRRTACARRRPRPQRHPPPAMARRQPRPASPFFQLLDPKYMRRSAR